MMRLSIQIYSLIYSFIFGIIFSVFTELNYRFLFSKKIVIKIIFTFIYIIDFSLLYFIILKRINNGIIHNYFLLSILLGYIFATIFFKRPVIIFKNKVKSNVKKVSNRKK